jgi:hypothetical protein
MSLLTPLVLRSPDLDWVTWLDFLDFQIADSRQWTSQFPYCMRWFLIPVSCLSFSLSLSLLSYICNDYNEWIYPIYSASLKDSHISRLLFCRILSRGVLLQNWAYVDIVRQQLMR